MATSCSFLELRARWRQTPLECEYDEGGDMECVVAFWELFRGVSGIRLRTPPGAHLERPESSFGALGELHCGRIGAHFPGSAGLRSLGGMNSFHNSAQLTIQSAQLN